MKNNLHSRLQIHCIFKKLKRIPVSTFKMDFHLVKVKHAQHYTKYKKVIFERVFSTFVLPNEIEKYLFNFIGVFPLFGDALRRKATGFARVPFQELSLLHTYGYGSLPYTEDDLATFES